MCQGNLAFGLLQNEARNTAVTNAPSAKAIAVRPPMSAFQGKTTPPFPDPSPKRKRANAKFTKAQITFNGAGETLLNGVICVWPVIPLIRWGRALK